MDNNRVGIDFKAKSEEELRAAIASLGKNQEARLVLDRWLMSKGLWVAQGANDLYILIAVAEDGRNRRIASGMACAAAYQYALELLTTERYEFED